MTPRRLQVLKLLAEGLSAKMIADKLGISRRTVEKSVAELHYWFEAKNTPHMMVLAIREGFIN